MAEGHRAEHASEAAQRASLRRNRGRGRGRCVHVHPVREAGIRPAAQAARLDRDTRLDPAHVVHEDERTAWLAGEVHDADPTRHARAVAVGFVLVLRHALGGRADARRHPHERLLVLLLLLLLLPLLLRLHLCRPVSFPVHCSVRQHRPLGAVQLLSDAAHHIGAYLAHHVQTAVRPPSDVGLVP